MQGLSRIVRALAAAATLAVAGGCAVPGTVDDRDPLENYNRAMYGINEGFDQIVATPLASAYRDLAPDPLRMWVRNFFANIADLFIGANNLMQGKPGDALSDWARFGFNTTFGLFGIHDVASEFGFEKHDEDFGQTLGVWFMKDPGPYLIWPILGSSTFRDSLGRVVEMSVDPVRKHRPVDTRNALIVARALSLRADLLDASRILEEAALDKYVFQRDAYLQRRRNQVYDGSPPREGASARPAAEPAASAPSVEAPADVNPAPGAGVDAVSGAPAVPVPGAAVTVARGDR